MFRKRFKHEKLIIINELINTIKQLHNTNHIHGDLKPNNVLCLMKQKCVLIDFDTILSLSVMPIYCESQINCKKTMGLLKNHYNYISGYSTDIYSLGVSIIDSNGVDLYGKANQNLIKKNE